jgi:predicted flavoprotein YhiN
LGNNNAGSLSGVKRYDLIVVGAGAAGLSSAIAFERRCDGDVLLIEANGEAGRKILAAGNGRCNLSNTAAPGWEKTSEFFGSLGVLLDTDEAGRAYPLARRADAVRDALVRECENLGCAFMLRTRVTGVKRGDGDDFVVTAGDAEQRSFRAMQVIVATGGKARPAFGNLGDGYAFARALGVSVNPIRPVLTPLLYADGAKAGLAGLAGVRAKAAVRLILRGGADGKEETLAEARGEVQFTDYGLSGICIFDLSRYYGRGGADKDAARYAVSIDFAPDYKEEEIAELLAAGRAAGLAGVVHPKIAARIEKTAGADGPAAKVKNFVVPVGGAKGWKEAQITAGGVAMTEVSEKYFESKAVPGLYFVGETLDGDGPSGGYNLDHAWNTGLNAGRAAGAYCASYLNAAREENSPKL